MISKCLFAQLAPADMQTTISSTVVTPTLDGRSSPLFSAPMSSISPSANTSRTKGLQLGGNKPSSSGLAAQLAEEVANEAGEGTNRLWNDDLIDINADEGDWSTYVTFDDIIFY